MNDKDELTIYCSRCGAEMKQSARYCMKCGNLNYDHPDNAKFQKYQNKKQEQGTYEVGSKQKIIKEAHGSVVFGNNMGGKNLCFWVNMFAFLLIMIITIIIAVVMYSDNLVLVVYSSFPVIWLLICLWFLLFYGTELMYMKANKPWYAAFIPIYDLLVIAEMAMGSMIWAILYLIPFGSFIILYNLGQKFDNLGIPTLLLGPLFFPVLGYSSSILYEGYNYVEDVNENAVEKDYGKKNIMRKIIAFVFIASIIMFIASNFTSWRRSIMLLEDEALVRDAEKLIQVTNKKIASGSYTCDNASSKIVENGTYYFGYMDASEVGVGNSSTSGYVKIIVSYGARSTFVSISNSDAIIKETSQAELNAEKVVKSNENLLIPKDGISCTVK